MAIDGAIDDTECWVWENAQGPIPTSISQHKPAIMVTKTTYGKSHFFQMMILLSGGK